MHGDHERPLRELDDRRDVVHRIEGQLVQARVHRVAARHQQQGVAVGRRFDRELGTQVAAGAGLVLDDHRRAETKPGAGGNLGAEFAVKSAPDGYTLLLVAGSYTVNPSLYKLSFDPVNDITTIIQLSQGPFIVAVHPSQ